VGVLSDKQIRERVTIRPFETAQKRPGRISFGVSSYGYDVRVGSHFKIFTPTTRSGDVAVVDPKSFSDDMMVEVDVAKNPPDRQYVIIPPNSFALCETVEYLEIPRDVLAICVGKSTYARCGLIVNVTPLEPEWRGKVTLEISNTTPLRGSRSSSSSRPTRCARCRTRTRAGSTRIRAASRCRRWIERTRQSAFVIRHSWSSE
jgi:dCTP deaminase